MPGTAKGTELRKALGLHLPDWAQGRATLPVMLVAAGWVTYPREQIWEDLRGADWFPFPPVLLQSQRAWMAQSNQTMRGDFSRLCAKV